uniref:Uncharacterized protein n=1 Tax=Lotus japonicus TaxID=34305 RepID=I3SGR3_LOTJA|nr:unknown [Lotus japonicus]
MSCPESQILKKVLIVYQNQTWSCNFHHEDTTFNCVLRRILNCGNQVNSFSSMLCQLTTGLMYLSINIRIVFAHLFLTEAGLVDKKTSI